MPRESLDRQDEARGCRVGAKTQLRGRGVSARSQAREVMRARVQTEWFNVVFARSGPGPDRTRLVPSRREELAQRAARWPVWQSVKVSVS